MTHSGFAYEPLFVLIYATVTEKEDPTSKDESVTEPVVHSKREGSNDIHISGEGYTFKWKRPEDFANNSEYVPLGTSSRVIDLRAGISDSPDEDDEQERDSA